MARLRRDREPSACPNDHAFPLTHVLNKSEIVWEDFSRETSAGHAKEVQKPVLDSVNHFVWELLES